MRLRVAESQGAAPRTAEDHPAIDAEMGPEPFDVVDQVPRRIGFEARVRRALTTAPLVEENEPVGARIEESPLHRMDTAARTAVEKDHWLALGRADLLVVQLVAVGYREPATVVGLDGR